MTNSTPSPCNACPWRVANHGRPHPDGWYTAANRNRLWVGLRRGEGMSCHPTDPNNEVSDAARAAGYRPAPEHAEVRECVGALILQQREFARLQDDYGVNLASYKQARPKGLTQAGIRRILERALLGGTPFGGPAMATPNLNDPEIQHPALGDWTSRNQAKEPTA